MNVFWTEFAKRKLDDIFKYYSEKSKNVAVGAKLVNGIIDHTLGLENQPYIGKIEDLLVDKPNQFRYLVYRSHKIIYWVDTKKNRIGIVHVFDTRQASLEIRNFK
jgi:plasmid stabilization system protein ParE